MFFIIIIDKMQYFRNVQENKNNYFLEPYHRTAGMFVTQNHLNTRKNQE